jgi:hypothetical protein
MNLTSLKSSLSRRSASMPDDPRECSTCFVDARPEFVLVPVGQTPQSGEQYPAFTDRSDAEREQAMLLRSGIETAILTRYVTTWEDIS